MTKRASKKRRVAVLFGGTSAEREISLKTGRSVYKALKDCGFASVSLIDVDKEIAKKLRTKKIEVVFIALHGSPGEDGKIQGLLEVMGIPYTGSGVLSSALCMDKIATKEVLHYHGILTPPFRVLNPGSNSSGGLKLPCVVKPPDEGSAIGVTLVKKRDEFKEAFKVAGKFSSEVLVESYIDGREVTVSVLDSQTALPVIEIRPNDEFYDFKAKYTAGNAEFIVPAKLNKTELKGVRAAALASYNALRCTGAARVDIIISAKGDPYVIEVNTVPGMTEMSLLPKAALSAGISYGALVEEMLVKATLDSQSC
ncbi:MAG: D-alanine--D-alanine ligase [Proteobacteria bacterium]|nr:D-alanine--D-alanine ligase [Pseudomonadota bacterium]